MNVLAKFAMIVMLFVGAAGLSLATTQSAAASSDNKEKAAQATETKDDDRASVYQYTAQRGDSYTVLARKAVQTYGIVNDVNLSQAQIIYAETQLTLVANSPELTIGQNVELTEDTVKRQIEAAEKLSDAQEALWQQYVAGVDFNTDNNGEAQEN